jgi:UDP-N-acetylglucosamine:LPS N-acetylglucosamine transferase
LVQSEPVRRNILIVSASMGAGHDGAARELWRRLEAHGHHVEIVDFLDAVAFRIGPALRWFYEVQLKFFPWSYELSYRMSPLLRGPAVMVDTWLTRRKLRKAIKRFRPETIVSVYPLASLVLGRMRRKGLLRVPVLTFLTDFAVHSLWVHRGVDVHLAVSEISAGTALSRGGKVARARGPLVGDRFRHEVYDRDATRRSLGLSPSERAVLVVAGSWGVGEVVATVEAIGRSGEFHPITVCGRDEKLRAELEERGYGTVIGWTDQMPALMTAADALVENAGGLTCMEAFAAGLPVVTYLPIAGHGRENAEVMARAGVNRYAQDEDELHEVLRSVTRPGPERDALVTAGRALFVADPADDVEELAESKHLVDRKGRVVPYRHPARRRVTTIVAASLVFLYSALTIGAEMSAAIGVGVAKPPKGVASTLYVGVRLDHRDLGNQALLDRIRLLDASVVVDAQAVRGRASQLGTLADHGVDVANGGWGQRQATLLRWNRAKKDVYKAGRAIERRAGERAREFVPGRRVDAFDQYFSRRARQKVVVPDVTLQDRDDVAAVEAGKVYVIDGRRSAPHATERAVANFATRADRARLHIAPLEDLR